ncbi:hypothetical protein ACFWCB_11430 [Streptomyces sp. NPDC060048]|uniref:hypothetical protein n=1 Tax=unclassified Streptomyces TaxID=2593676 RepID=UPI003698C842
MSIGKRGFGVVGACAALLAVTACGVFGSSAAPRVTEDQLVGRWIGDCGASIDVSKDHTFTAKDFPVDFKGVGTKPELASGSGTWRLARAVEGVSPQELSLYLGERGFDLSVGGSDDEIRLLWSVGDPDYAYKCEFTAKSSE